MLTGDAGPVPEEGTLLPETYLFTRGETRAHLLAKMASAQEKILAEKWAGRASGLPLPSLRDAVTLASIVEKQNGGPQDGPPRPAQPLATQLALAAFLATIRFQMRRLGHQL